MLIHVIPLATLQSRHCHCPHFINVDAEAGINNLPKVTEFQLGCKPRRSHSRVNWVSPTRGSLDLLLTISNDCFQFFCCLTSWYYLTLLLLPWLLWPRSLLVLLLVCLLHFGGILWYRLHFLCSLFIHLPRCCPHSSYLFSLSTVIPLEISSYVIAFMNLM